uniref:HCLS1-binding protein 3-like n=1 Tax=Crassostrea virginica TaxID=6565 RepID=A0A8B8DSF9_CRAVI|nr:HCLS1-binding protein 3-like [Crassostrea virginica]
MPSATVTIRELKNKHTGIDITVPRYTQEKGLLQSTYEYQVVVVSNLPYFKSPKHKESDVVQFMVKKRFSDFEDLWNRLFEKHHSLVLPPLPKKALLVNDKLAMERRSGLEKFLSFLASSPKVCTSSLLLEFLGVNAIKAGKYTQEGLKTEGEEEGLKTEGEEEGGQAEEGDTGPETKGNSGGGLFEDEEEEEEEEGLFDEEEETEVVPDMTGILNTDTKLFDYPMMGGNFGGEEEGEMFREEPTQKPSPAAQSPGEDNSDLLTVQDDLDELFLSKPSSNSNDTHKQVKPKPTLKPRPGKTISQVTGTGKPALQPKPKPAAKPALKPKPSAKQSDDSNQREATSGADNLDTDDIMKYIQNAEETEDDVDLFS